MKKRIDSLEALRALACIAMFLFHGGINISGAGAACVFFMLSGFTLSLSELRRGTFSNPGLLGSAVAAVKRIRRLYALHIVCLLPILALNLWEMSRGISYITGSDITKRLIASLLLLQSWVPDSSVAVSFNGVAWFLSTLLFLYFCFPFIFSLLRKLSSVRAALLAILVLAAVQTALGFAASPLESLLLGLGLIPADGKFSYWFSYIFPVFRLFDFSVGCILAWIFAAVKDKTRPAHACTAEIASLILLIFTHLLYKYSTPLPGWEAFKYTQIFVPFSAVVIFTFALGQGPAVKWLTNRFTLFIAGISSDFFLIHQDVIRFTTIFLSVVAIPVLSSKIFIIPFCFALTVISCLVWAWIKKAVRIGQ